MKKVSKKTPIQIYTDGSFCHYKGGYAFVISMGEHYKEFFSDHFWTDTTSQRMEIRAILEAFKQVKTGYVIDLSTDSTYCANMINQYLVSMNVPRGLKKNRNLWGEVFKTISKHLKGGSKISVRWVRRDFNHRADELAMKSRNSDHYKVCGRSKEPK